MPWAGLAWLAFLFFLSSRSYVHLFYFCFFPFLEIFHHRLVAFFTPPLPTFVEERLGLGPGLN